MNQRKKSSSAALLTNLSPGKPVKVGDSWAVPVKPIVDAMDDMPADPEKSKSPRSWSRSTRKGQSRFGTFEITTQLRPVGQVRP